MSAIPKWFERKFDFTFPVELWPNLVVRLRGTPARAEEMVREIGREVLIRKDPGTWSAQEHMGHLLDLESLWAARVEDYVAGKTEMRAADLRNRKTDEAGHTDRAVEEILRDFRAARGHLVQQVERLDAAKFRVVIPHPRLKVPMRLVDHLAFVAEHDDHHLARIWEMTRHA